MGFTLQGVALAWRRMNGGPHPYQELSLSSTGMVLGIVLSALYAICLLKSEASMAWAKKAHRNHQAGTYAMAIGMVWFWLLVAPNVKGSLSFMGSLSMDLGEFTKLKPYLQLGVPLFCVGMIMYVREFLFVRGLGLCLLMAAAPILYAADFETASMRVLMPLVAYGMIIKGLFYVGMPYLFRDGVSWATATKGRWKVLSSTGLALGLVILGCSLTVWRGY